MKNYLEETLDKQLKVYRDYESSIEKQWGGKKRLYKCVDVKLEIKFAKAEMLFNESLKQDQPKRKIEMIQMMYRAYKALIDAAKANGFRKLKDDYRCYQYKNNKIVIVCDTNLQKPRLEELYGKDKDVILFSVEELFNFVNPKYLDAKETFKQKNIDITFKKVSYK